eukprot:875494_1
MDVSEENTYFEWKITNYLLKKWKNAKYKQVFHSPLFNAIGQEWSMMIYPNGNDREGTADLFIMCRPIKEKELNVYHYIGIDALNHCEINVDGNATLHKDRNFIHCTSPFIFDDLQNQSEITICVKIWQKGSIDRNKGQFVLKDKMMKLQHQSAATIHNLQNEHREAIRTVLKENGKKIESYNMKSKRQSNHWMHTYSRCKLPINAFKRRTQN